MYAALEKFGQYEPLSGRWGRGTEATLADWAATQMGTYYVVHDVEDADEIGGYRQDVLASGYYDPATAHYDGAESPEQFAARLFREARLAAGGDHD